MSKLNSDYEFAVTPSIATLGRPKGGLAILWNKKLDAIIEPCLYSDFLMGLKIKNNNSNVILLNVYMPCDLGNQESSISYKSNLAFINDVIETENPDNVIIAGDFNSDPFKGRFFKYLSSFTERLNFVIADVFNLPRDSFTYLSYAHNTTRSRCGFSI